MERWFSHLQHSAKHRVIQFDDKDIGEYDNEEDLEEFMSRHTNVFGNEDNIMDGISGSRRSTFDARTAGGSTTDRVTIQYKYKYHVLELADEVTNVLEKYMLKYSHVDPDAACDEW